MKTALVLLAALTQAPQQEVGLASMALGDTAKCSAPEGCIIITKATMNQLLLELSVEAAKACRDSKKGWL